jgi:hypothetical protein
MTYNLSRLFVSRKLHVAELTPVVAEAFYREEIGVGHAVLLAKLLPDQQEQALAACFKEDGSAGGQQAKRILLPARSLHFWIESNIFRSTGGTRISSPLRGVAWVFPSGVGISYTWQLRAVTCPQCLFMDV